MFINNISDFDLEQTFECGQCFRWSRQNDGRYTGVAGGYVITVSRTAAGFEFDCDDEEFIYRYFDLHRDYAKVKKAISNDDIITGALSAGSGIRLLKQDPWEALVSFIISANNNIPRIKKIISLLCAGFGRELGGGITLSPRRTHLPRLNYVTFQILNAATVTNILSMRRKRYRQASLI